MVTILVLVSGCMSRMKEPTWRTVMSDCDISNNGAKNINAYKSCIKLSYKRHTDDPGVREFFAIMESISEDLASNKVSISKAFELAGTAYRNTVAADNARRQRSSARASTIYNASRPRTCYHTGYTTTCY